MKVIEPISAPCSLEKDRSNRYSRATGAHRGSNPMKVLFRRVELFRGVLHHRDGVELDVGETAVLFLDTANVDILNDVARVRVDLDGTARAVRVPPALEDHHCLVAVEFPLGALD